MVLALRDGRKTMTRRLLSHADVVVLDRATAARHLRWSVGDRLWVKETWALDGGRFIYAADHPERKDRWTSSRFMPKAAARFWLTVTALRVERLQEIGEADAEAEGMPEPYLGDGDPPFEEQAVIVSRTMQFRNLWNDLHGAGAWDANPWVAVISFEVER